LQAGIRKEGVDSTLTLTIISSLGAVLLLHLIRIVYIMRKGSQRLVISYFLLAGLTKIE